MLDELGGKMLDYSKMKKISGQIYVNCPVRL